jgi:hypothetical protein
MCDRGAWMTGVTSQMKSNAHIVENKTQTSGDHAAIEMEHNTLQYNDIARGWRSRARGPSSKC